MNTIYWLASYPKSGNTWMRILLSNYILDADMPVDINHLHSGQIASSRAVFDEFTGGSASDWTEDEIEVLRPLVYKQMAKEVTAPFFVKIHDAFIYVKANQPLIPYEATAGVIYVIRNPLDVAVSFAYHSNVSVDKSVRHMADVTYTFCPNQKRLESQLRQRLLSWNQHVSSWVDAPDFRVHVVRYEDLKADTFTALEGVLRFCGLEVEAKRIHKAVKFSTFDTLACQEKESGFCEKSPRTASFFRQGKVGSWTQDMTIKLSKQVIAAHGEVMARFGYL